MPELPEVETIRQELVRRVTGRTIRSVDVRLPKLVAVGPVVLAPTRRHPPSLVRRFVRVLRGSRILAVGRFGKLLLMKLSGAKTLLVHLKMAGQIVVTKPGVRTLVVRLLNVPTVEPEQLPSKHTHLVLSLSGRVTLFYNDIRKFGTWRLVDDRDLDKVPDLAAFGPDAFDPRLTLGTFIGRVGRVGGRPIKVALTDQTAVAGVGNIYADESLFRAKLHPLRPTRSIRPAEWKKLFVSLRRVLKEAIALHGSSVGEFIRTDGTWGGAASAHRVYQKTGRPCRRCGTAIRRITLAGRGTHFCPHCQPRTAQRGDRR